MNIKPENVNVQERLPIGGVFVFALGSIHSLRHLFTVWAKHDSWLFWLLAGAIEAATAFLVWKLVEAVRMATKSNQKAEDRKFYIILAAVLTALALPSLSVSVAANFVEFGGNVGLALLCPTMAVACAVLSALPEAERKFQERKRQEAAEVRKTKEANRKRREAERQQAEARRQQEETERQQAEARRKFLNSLGSAGQTMVLYEANPHATQTEIAALADVSERTIRNHLDALEVAGLVRRRNGGVEILS